MEVKGIVTELLKNNVAKVMIERASACGGNCHNCLNTCGSKSEIFAKYSETLEKGDEVIISERSNKVLMLSILVFMVPLISMIIIYKLCIGFINNEETSSLIALFGGIAVFLIFVLYFRRLKMPVCRKANENTSTERIDKK